MANKREKKERERNERGVTVRLAGILCHDTWMVTQSIMSRPQTPFRAWVLLLSFLCARPKSPSLAPFHFFSPFLPFFRSMAPVTVSSSGIGVAHLPNQRHKIVTNRGANFTVMVCGKLSSLARHNLLPNFINFKANRVSERPLLSTRSSLLLSRITKILPNATKSSWTAQ